MRHKLRNNLGVSLLELLIAAAIISTLLVPILGFYNYSIRQNNRTKEETRVKFLAEEELEKYVALRYHDPMLDVYGSTAGRTNFYEIDAFIVKSNVVFIDPETGEIPELYPVNKLQDTFLKRIIVSASRKDKNGGQVDLVYYKSP